MLWDGEAVGGLEEIEGGEDLLMLVGIVWLAGFFLVDELFERREVVHAELEEIGPGGFAEESVDDLVVIAVAGEAFFSCDDCLCGFGFVLVFVGGE